MLHRSSLFHHDWYPQCQDFHANHLQMLCAKLCAFMSVFHCIIASKGFSGSKETLT